jgi:hypothetical protein
MVDIIPETINRIRLSDDELKLLHNVLKKIDLSKLKPEEKKFCEILLERVEGRLNLKKKNPEL